MAINKANSIKMIFDKKKVKKITFFLLLPFYLLIIFELFLRFAPPLISFLREPRIFEKQKQNFKIYALGDSFTYGLGLKRNESYPALLEKKLRSLPGKNFQSLEVINMGVPAHSLSTFYYKIKELHETGKDHNSLIILQGGWNCNDNDFIRFKKQNSQDLMTKIKLFLNNLRTYRFVKSYYLYKKIYYPYGKEDYVPPFMSMGEYNFADYQKIALEYLEKIVNYSRKNNIKVVFLNYPQNTVPENPKTDLEFYHYLFGHKKLTEEDYLVKDDGKGEIAINRLIRSETDKYQLPLIDLNQAFKNSEEKDLFQDDYHHPNKRGAEIMAETIYKELLEKKLLLISD